MAHRTFVVVEIRNALLLYDYGLLLMLGTLKARVKERACNGLGG